MAHRFFEAGGAGALEISVARRMTEIDPLEWDSLLEAADRPLLSWGFLALLEESGSIRPETGWEPFHFLLREKGEGGAARGRLLAAAPFYGRSGSWGDFVFDFDFAEAADRMGAAYYPKLVGAVPVTPAPAWRVLVAPGSDRPALEALLVAAAEEAARASGFGGIHLLWPEPEAAARILSLPRRRGERGSWRAWGHQAFLWKDEGYGDFEGYLDSFSKNMRRNVRREREALRAAGLETRAIGPAEASPSLLRRMAQLYDAHNDRFGPWAARFLTEDFFLRLPEFMPEGWVMGAAFERGAGDEALALSFLLEGPRRLYGRYWGAARDLPGLHFELCYYLPIERALARGIPGFDPGMGSPHKARRGFRSLVVPSLHLPFDPRVESLMETWLPRLGEEASREAAALNEELPFKKSPGAQAGSTTL